MPRLAALALGASYVAGSVAADCINMTTLEARMPQWVGKVPYSHAVNKAWGYPTDCSGFVSWALQAGRDLKAFEYGSDTYSARIPTDELRYGDVITHVFSDSHPDQCKYGADDTAAADGAAAAALAESGSESDLPRLAAGESDYVSGHVFFFDKWDDANHTHFWAYESTETFDQTKECHEHKPEKCFNHHVRKSRSVPDSWRHNNCSTSKHGFVTGGPHRLVPSLLCPAAL